MTTLIRYALGVSIAEELEADPHPEGEWVKYDDVKHLLSAESSVPTGKLSAEMWESFDHEEPIVGWVDAERVAKWVRRVEQLERAANREAT